MSVIRSTDFDAVYDSSLCKMHLESSEISICTVNGTVWFRGNDVAGALGYSHKANAINAHVDEDYKRPLRYLVQQGIPKVGCLSVDSNELASIWINEAGFFALTMASKLPLAKKYQRWVFSEVLPSIHKTGSYAPNSEEALLKAYNNMQVVYYGDVGVHKGEHLLKFGCSDSITKRVHDGHKKDFPEFTLQNVFSVMNNREVESKLKEDAEIKKRRVTRTINEKKQTELVVLSADFTCKDLDAIIHRTIAQNPPGLMNSLKRQLETEDKDLKMRKLDMQIEMRRIELELDIKKADNEVELKRLDLQHKLELTKLHYAHKGAADLMFTGREASNAVTENVVGLVEDQGPASGASAPPTTLVPTAPACSGPMTALVPHGDRKIVVVDQAMKRLTFNTVKEAAEGLQCHQSTVQRGLKEPGRARKGLQFTYELSSV